MFLIRYYKINGLHVISESRFYGFPKTEYFTESVFNFRFYHEEIEIAVRARGSTGV